jgi:hypothetical protein
MIENTQCEHQTAKNADRRTMFKIIMSFEPAEETQRPITQTSPAPMTPTMIRIAMKISSSIYSVHMPSRKID